MAYIFHGIGTTFYGAGDWEPDGGCCTTKWFVVFYIPLIPLGSYRMPGLEPRPLNFGQVIRTYLFAAGVVAWGFVSGAVLFDDFGNKNLPWIVDAATIVLWGLLLLTPFVALWWWQRRERSRVLADGDGRYRPSRHP